MSPEAFEEIQIIGDQYLFHSFSAKILPDRNFIYDLTFDESLGWVEISEEEFNEIRSKINS